MRAIDLNGATRDVLAPVCRTCDWCQRGRPAEDRPASPSPRLTWEYAVEAEAGFFGRALLDGDKVLGWMHTAPAHLVSCSHSLPAGPPAADAFLLMCSYFYDEQYLTGFQRLLQEIQAALKHRRVAALEAFAATRSPAEERFRGYLREANLFNPEVLEGNGFRPVRRVADVSRYRLELATLVATSRRSRSWEELEPGAAAQPV